LRRSRSWRFQGFFIIYLKSQRFCFEEPKDIKKSREYTIYMEKMNKPNEEWKKELPPDVYRVTREKGTEPPFNNKYWDSKEKGIYKCSNCGLELFSSDSKFDSGTGWPSFTAPLKDAHVETEEDNKFFMRRTEVICSRCGAHLGHVFPDGPKQMPDGTPASGLRYCMNSCSLDLEKKEEDSPKK
jgi:peptide-methionine (R)-S-oxide reductase